MFKHSLLLTFLLSISSTLVINSGIWTETIVKTSSANVLAGNLKIGDTVVSLNKLNQEQDSTVISVEKKNLNEYIKIKTENEETIICAPDQKIFTPFKFKEAHDLSLNDYIFTGDQKITRVISINKVNEPKEMVYIELDKNYHYMIGESGIIIHNGPIGAGVGFWLGKGLVWGAASGAIAVICLPANVAGPAAYTAATGAMIGTFSAPIEAASNIAALGGSIIMGAGSGPI